VGKANLAVMAGALAAVAAAVASIGLRHRGRSPAAIGGGAAPAPTSVSPASSAPAAPPTGKVASGPPGMIHLDAHHTNRSPFAGPRTPSVAWTFDAGGPIEAAPAVTADGTIVVASLGGKLTLLDASGHAKFSTDLGDRAYASPLVTPDGIFVGSDADRFFALDAKGGVRWKLDTDGDADTGAALAPWGGIVFAAGRMVYAVRPNGNVLWRVKTRRKTFASPAVGDDGTVYFGSQDNHVYAVAQDGKTRWRTDVEADADGAPAIADDGTVYVGTDKGELLALAPGDGAIRWRRAVGGFVRGTLSVARDGTILAGTYGPAPRVVALEPEHGELRWSFAIQGTGAPEFGIHGAPVEDAEQRLYFGAQDDFVYALARDGALLWKLKTGGDVDAPVVIAPDGTLLVGSDDGKLYAVRDR
jgi:outer membrane protein assembly factor BamB